MVFSGRGVVFRGRGSGEHEGEARSGDVTLENARGWAAEARGGARRRGKGFLGWNRGGVRVVRGDMALEMRAAVCF